MSFRYFYIDPTYADDNDRNFPTALTPFPVLAMAGEVLCGECHKLGPYIRDHFQLPDVPTDITWDPLHPLYDAWQWDQQFMKETGWDWCKYYGALVELRTGHNPNHRG